MNRRRFFAKIVAVAPVVVAPVVVAVTPSARVAYADTDVGHPKCPRCQAWVQYVEPAWASSIADTETPVRCGCGWYGMHVRVRSFRG